MIEQDKFTLRLFYSACILCILFASSILTNRLESKTPCL
ncbi:Uncharacterised protein [Vibrio cholerae]|nr:Uncharacterised protein [Vibrio cholerae]CSI28648.1 Uncharacterised protein [Vibrio cholerae]